MRDLLRSSDEAVVLGALIAVVLYAGATGVAAAPIVEVRSPEQAYEARFEPTPGALTPTYAVELPPPPPEPPAPTPAPPAPPIVAAAEEAPPPPPLAAVPAADPVAAVERTPPPTPNRVERPARRAPRPRQGSKPCPIAPDPLIVVAPDLVQVDREVIRRYTRDWSAIDDLGWSRQHDGPDGKPQGLQVGGFRCGSDPYDAGFRAGDVIVRVNGHKVNNLLQAAIVYAKVAGDEFFDIDILRGGEARLLRFQLLR